jgi:hypothetical protein
MNCGAGMRTLAPLPAAISLIVPVTLLGTVLLGVQGCARVVWTKADFNQADWNRDTYECERDMRQSGYFGTGLVAAINAQEFQERCLVAKGYYKVVVGNPTPPTPPSRPSTLSYRATGGITEADTSGKCDDPNCICSADGMLIKCSRKPWGER